MERDDMTTQTTTQTAAIARPATSTTGIVAAMAAGLLLLFLSGYAQATILHDAAHDQRHAMAFPCH
ncbi:CbtB-domain containing protein [Dinoroseobacter sp. PD6]|nr:CbtB domain-containing protein [Dinoroseobacter sp. PD6]MDD9717294.1 CbtB-domain containing protein [Dinoroseobacter sp. PD6]